MYNSPAQQMQRLRDAGLNPNLVYGNGAVGNTSSKTPEYNAPHVQSTIDPGNPVEILSQYQNAQTQRLQQENLKQSATLIKAQAAKAKADAVVSGKRAGILSSEAVMKKIEASYAEELTKTQVNTAGQHLQNLIIQNRILQIEKDIKKEELELRKNGFTNTDPVYVRAMSKYWEEIMSYGLDEDDLPRQLLDGYRKWKRSITEKTNDIGGESFKEWKRNTRWNNVGGRTGTINNQ